MRKLVKYLGAALTMIIVVSCTKDKVLHYVPDCKDTISFSTQILPMIQENCTVCHDGTSYIPTYNNHHSIAASANDMLHAMRGTGGFTLMPEGGPPLNDTLIEQFTCWVHQGKLDN